MRIYLIFAFLFILQLYIYRAKRWEELGLCNNFSNCSDNKINEYNNHQERTQANIYIPEGYEPIMNSRNQSNSIS